MKILFITPLFKPSAERWMPLGICSMAAVLKNRGHGVFLFDRTAEFSLLKNNRARLQEKMKQQIETLRPDLIAFSTVSPAIHDTAGSVAFIRGFYQGTLVAGGHHATALPSETLENIPGLDAVITGEGEYTLAALADHEDPKCIPGFYGRNTPLPGSNPPCKITPLDDLPFPLLGILNMPYYTQANSATIRGFYLSTASVLTARGCYHNCSYCAESLTYGQGVRFHSPEYSVDNIKRIITDYPVNGLYFLDNDFIADRERAEEICRLFIADNLHKRVKWAVQTRSDRLDVTMIRMLKKAGCVKVEMGIESFNQKMLEKVNKAVTRNNSIRSIQLCRKNGLTVHAYMLTGLETESVADLNRQLSWIKKLRPDSFSWTRINLYPGTRLYNEKGHRYFETHDWSEDSVQTFFDRDLLTSIDPMERKNWMEQQLKPYMWWTLSLSHLRNNDMKFILNALFNKTLAPRMIEGFKRLIQLVFPGN